MARYLDANEIRNFDVNGETFDLLALIEALEVTPEGWTHPESVADLKVGQIVHVWALGAKLRRGVVIKLGRTKASVAFTTQGAVDEAIRYRGGKDIRVADSAVQLSQIYVRPAAAPVVEIEEPAAEIEEAPEVTETECPECGGPLASDGVCADDSCGAEVDDECEAKGCDIPEGLGECRRCGAELVEIEEPEALTLNSHDGKVDPMNNDANDTQTETPAVIRETTGSAVVRLLERVHERIRQNHPEVPAVVIVTGAGIGVFGGKWGHFRPQGWTAKDEADKATHIHEMFMAGETLAKGSRQVLQTMLHESAHALAEHRGEQDTSRQGRWHNGVFRKTAEELGLAYRKEKANPQIGYSEVVLTDETVAEYKDLLDALDAEIHLMVRLPGWLGGAAGGDEDGEDQGGENMGKAPKTGDPKPNTNNVKCVCRCEEPNIIRMSRKVLDQAVVTCSDCDSLFSAA